MNLVSPGASAESATECRPLEITDLIMGWDEQGVRLPISQATATQALSARGQAQAVRILRRLPTQDGMLVDSAVDETVLRVHLELQRLAEELQQPRRVLEHINLRVEALLATATNAPVYVIDVGCGLGYTARWLSARGGLDPRVHIIGVDTNRTLIEAATRLAGTERLGCRFVCGDAARLEGLVDDPRRAVIVSSGLLHHMSLPQIRQLVESHSYHHVDSFAHWDLVPGKWSVLGAWLFHRARMREAISRHDGVASARRAWSAEELLSATSGISANYDLLCRDPGAIRPPLTSVLRPLVGTVREK